MKPHLPKKLTAALLAACTALALNTTAAAATGTQTFTGGDITLNRGDSIFDNLYVSKTMTTGTASASHTMSDLMSEVNITQPDDFRAVNCTISVWVTRDSLQNDCLIFSYGGGRATTDDYGANGFFWDADAQTLRLGRGKITDNYSNMAWKESSTSSSLASAIGTTGDMVNFTFAVQSASQAETPTIWVNGQSVETLATYAGNMNGTANPMNLYAGTGVTYGNVSITTTKLTEQADIYALMGVSTEKPAEAFDYVWKGGTDGKWDTTTANWETKADPGTPVTFTSGAENTVTFGADAERTEVTLSVDASVASVTVNDGYKLTIDSGSSLTTGTLSIAGGEATIDGAGALTAQTLSIAANGTLNLATTGTLSIGAMSFGTGSKLNIGAAINMGTLALTSSDAPAIQVKDGGELTISTASKVDGQGLVSGTDGELAGTQAFTKLFKGKAVAVETGGQLVLKGNVNAVEQNTSGGTYNMGMASLEVQGNLTVNTWNAVTYNVGGNTLSVTGDAWFKNHQLVNVAGGTLTVGGSLKMAHEGNDAAGQYLTTLTATEHSNLTFRDIVFYGGHNEVNVDGSTLSFTKAGGNVLSQAGTATPTAAADFNTVNLNNASLLADMYGWTLGPIDGTAVNLTGTTYLSVSTGRELAVTATSVNGSFSKNGGGTATVSGNGFLTDTVAVNQGTLNLAGTYAIDNNTGDMTITYTGGESDKNGFRTAGGTIIVYTQEKDTTLNVDDAKFTYEGSVVELTEGKYEAAAKTDNTIFYVNEGTEKVSSAKKQAEMEYIYMKGGTTLTVDENVSGDIIGVMDGQATVDIQSGKTVDGTLWDSILAGSGTYALKSGTAVLGTNTELGQDWAGTVRISGSTQNADWNALAHEGSKLELHGVSGWGKQWAAEAATYGSIDVDVVLTDTEALGRTVYAFTSMAGSGSASYTTKFTKSVSGTGTFAASAQNGTTPLKENYEFSGDISGWSGEFLFIKGVDTKLTFSGEASDINAKVNRNGGSLAMVVSTADEATFANEVDVSATTLNQSATFQENARLGTLSGTGDIVAEKDLAIGSTGTYSGTVDVTGTLLVNGTANLGDNLTANGDIVVGTAGSLTLTEGSTISSIIQNSGSVSLTGLTLDDSVFTETQGQDGAHFGLDGQETTGANYFTGTSASFVQVVDGGTSTGSDLTWGDLTEQVLTADGKIITVAADIDYDTFYVNADTVKVSDVTGVGHATKFIEVTGGTLDVDTTPGTPGAPTITVTGEGTLTGDELDVTRVHIDEQAIVHVTDELVSGGVTFYAAEGSDVSITNTGRKRAYSTEMEDMLVQAGGIVKTTEEADEDVTVSNILEVGEIINTQGGKLTLDGVSEAIEVKNLIIGLAENPAATVEMLVSGSQTETTVTVTETLAAGNGTLLANLVMADDSALLVGGVEKALHVGSTLTMGTGIALDGLTLQALDDLAIGEDFWLMDAAAGRELVYTGATGEDAWYDGVFSRVSADGDYTLEGDFNIVFDDETDSLGLRKFSNTPEPTTGTLSLLALCALAARRRRK